MNAAAHRARSAVSRRRRRGGDGLAPRSGVRGHGLPRLGQAARAADRRRRAHGGAGDDPRGAGAPERGRAHRRRSARVGAGGVVRDDAPRPAAGPAAPLAERAAAAGRRRRGGRAGAGRVRGAAGRARARMRTACGSRRSSRCASARGCGRVRGPLDTALLAEAAALLPGRRDFAALTPSAHLYHSCVREVTRAEWRPGPPDLPDRPPLPACLRRRRAAAGVGVRDHRRQLPAQHGARRRGVDGRRRPGAHDARAVRRSARGRQAPRHGADGAVARARPGRGSTY